MVTRVDILHLLEGTNTCQINYDKDNKLYIKRKVDIKLYVEGTDFRVQNNGSTKLIIFHEPLDRESDYDIFYYEEDRD